MTDDQHRIGKLTAAKLAIADALERWTDTPAADRPDPLAVGAWVLDQLQNLGWRPPVDLTDTPPLRPQRAATDNSPGRQAFRQAREELAARKAGR